MRLAVIGCKVFTRELGLIGADSPNVLSFFWLEQGLHDTPDFLRTQLQAQIDLVDELQESAYEHKKFDAIVLAYGLCSNGVTGISSRTLPLVVPRCDDCVALFLGSQRRYLEMFASHKGTFWCNRSWWELGNVPSAAYYNAKLKSYAELYGEDNAQYLLDFENSWIQNYREFIYITSPYCDCPQAQEEAQRSAQQFGLGFETVPGDSSFIRRLVNGPWTDEEFFICPAGMVLSPSYDEGKFCCTPFEQKADQSAVLTSV